jgi:predicted metal-dependent enzyme (double-stranded beta helix superfamily)
MREKLPPFNLDSLVEDLKEAALQTGARARVKSIMEETVKDPKWVSETMPTFEENEVILFEDDTVSIWYCRFVAGQSVPPHDHQMVPTIAVYQGAERNVMWVRNDAGGIDKKTEIVVEAGDVLQVGPTAIHSVTRDGDTDSCAIHVYLGKLTTVDRSLFDTKTGEEMRFSDDNYNRLIGAELI